MKTCEALLYAHMDVIVTEKILNVELQVVRYISSDALHIFL